MSNFIKVCNVFGWEGQRLLKHLQLKENCRSNTDMDKVEAELNEIERKRKKEYHKKNREKILKKKKEHYHKNKADILKQRKIHSDQNKEDILQKKKIYSFYK